MKKIIIAAAVVLTAGFLTTINKENTVKSGKTARISVSVDKNVLGTAD